MILSAQTIRKRIQSDYKHPVFDLEIEPFCEKTKAFGLSYGLSHCGYDIRIGEIKKNSLTREVINGGYLILPGEFVLMSSLERVRIPLDICARVHDKSTLARQGLALQNTILEPGWEGHITLELSNHSKDRHIVSYGQPIAQVIFELLDHPTESPYEGKYQNQGPEPVPAIFEGVDNDGNC